LGQGGGATIAALLAAQRSDVLTLRSVAGILDTDAFSDVHGQPHARQSLNPADFAEKLRSVPQVHFIGGQDEIVPPAVLNSYLQKLGDLSCVDYMLIQEASHDSSWVDKWSELLKTKPTCQTLDAHPVFDAVQPAADHIYVSPEIPEKP
jgi:hypothetical protein